MKTESIVGAVFGTILKIMSAIIVVVLIYRGAIAGYEFGYKVFKQQPMALGEGRTVTVEITEDMSVKEIGELFLEKGLIDDVTLFTAQYYLSEFRENVKPGVYELSTDMTVEEMMEAMAAPAPEEGDEE